jgi:hypothetical protein
LAETLVGFAVLAFALTVLFFVFWVDFLATLAGFFVSFLANVELAGESGGGQAERERGGGQNGDDLLHAVKGATSRLG